MGGAVSSGRNNNELVDNLMEGSYIRTAEVERVFRALDRGDFMLPDDRGRAYKDIAWRNGQLHLSSPCIYSEVMEGLEVKPGQSFLNIGSGTGYLSTMVGLVLGSGGISHGIEIHPKVVDYAILMQRKFIENSPAIDDFDFCEPKFYPGNGLSLAPLPAGYDRVYCGAACPNQYANYFKKLIRIGGILVMPLNDTLVQVRRVSASEWSTRSLLNVSFAQLQLPAAGTARPMPIIDEQTPPPLQVLSRGVIRRALHSGVLRRHPELREAPDQSMLPRKRSIRHARRCPRRICIPIEEGRARNFNMLHDMRREEGANEMNALLSLVLSMGENRVAGALRLDSPSASSAEDNSEPETDHVPLGHFEDINRDSEISDGSEPEVELHPHFPSRRTINMVFRNLLGDARDVVQEREDEEVQEEAASPRSLTVEFHDSLAQVAVEGEVEVAVEGAVEVAAEGGVEDASEGAVEDVAEDAVEGVAAADMHEPFAHGVSACLGDGDLPADVDVYLDTTEGPRGLSPSDMEWEESRSADRPEPSSDGDTETASKGTEEKRQKLDSGIGEGNSPSSSSQEKTERSAASDTGDASDDTEPALADGRRRQKRLRTLAPTTSSEEEWSECEGELRRRLAQRASSAAGSRARSGAPARDYRRGPEGVERDLRRQRRARLVRHAINELPLPQQLKVYLNWGRSPAA